MIVTDENIIRAVRIIVKRDTNYSGRYDYESVHFDSEEDSYKMDFTVYYSDDSKSDGKETHENYWSRVDRYEVLQYLREDNLNKILDV